ncbi:asparagine synthase (glutamine-hydrolyzing) [Sulfobacillus sp. DSM 109850]|uniref:asparagine synthase (glutamine-hydrolyzing) n=1 Tax=Sulfobacillus harzensis TaxID=2729629 RepID=A0A7Y0L143_9FIRM|nr:asparagine synthase (glutamine-hydrolyzing) [Sulfobacillus harzensis]
MCGIAGIWRQNWYTTPEEIQQMLQALKHRGPDGEGVFIDRGLGLGMRRLAIRDLAHGAQPYVSEDGQVVAVYNGEIYNDQALRSWVAARGHRLRSDADGEVLVHLYEEEGPDFLSRLTGMYALAIWDRRRGELLLARDPLGQKPLYIWDMGRTMAFASEIKAFFGVPEFQPSLDEEALAEYLGHRFVPAPGTLLQGITKLEPGQALLMGTDGRKRRWRYWQPQLINPSLTGNLDDWADRLDAVLKEVARTHLVSDVPLGVFLSGGLDSSVLAALASRAADGPLEAWAATFPANYPGYDESAWAEKVANHVGVKLRTVPVDWIITPERVRELAYVLDEPMADPTVLPLDGLARRASERHTVMLSGEGADEIFGGYAGYGEVASLAPLRRIPAGIRRLWAQAGLPGSGAFRRSLVPVHHRYRGVGFTFSPEEQSALLVPELVHPDRSSEVAGYWHEHAHLMELQAMQGFDVRWFLPDDVLLKADRIGMHHNLEVRVPYCDHQVVELALQIPFALRRQGSFDKRVLRRVGERYLPSQVVYRPKSGFPTPLTSLMSGPLYDLAYDTLTSSRFRSRGWFQVPTVEALLGQLNGQSPAAARKVYALMMLELWAEELVEKGGSRLTREPLMHPTTRRLPGMR